MACSDPCHLVVVLDQGARGILSLLYVARSNLADYIFGFETCNVSAYSDQ